MRMSAILFFLFTASHFLLKAQEMYTPFDHMDNRRGLANSIVYDLVQDSRGSIWIASHHGLQRFNGTKFTSIKLLAENAVEPKVILKILLSKNEKTIWVVSTEGIFQYEIATKKTKKIPIDLNVSDWTHVSSFLQDAQGTIWICLQNGLFYFDEQNSRFQPYHKKWPATKFSIHSIQPSPDASEYWLATSNGIAKYQVKTKTYSYLDAPALKNNSQLLSRGHQTAAGSNAWLWYVVKDSRTGQHLLKGLDLLGDQKKFETTVNQDFNIWSAHFTRSKNALTLGNSVYAYNSVDKTWYDLLRETRASLNDKPLCLLEDRDGLLWVGTNNGIYVLKPNEFKLSYSNSLTWVDSLGSGIVPVGDSLILTLSFSNSKRKSLLQLVDLHLVPRSNNVISTLNSSQLSITTIGNDKNGTMWATSVDNKLVSIDFKKQRVNIDKASEFGRSKIIHLAADRDNNLWFVSDRLEVFKRSVVSNSISKIELCADSIRDANVHVLVDDDANVIWLTRPSSLIEYNIQKNQCKVYPLQSGLRVSEIKPWQNDSLILGTNKGIFLLHKSKPNALSKLKTSRGRYDDDVAALETDFFHNLWVASPGSGIFKITGNNKFIRGYTNQDGIFFQPPGYSLSLRLKDNKILVKTANGFLIFHTRQSESSLNPRVHLTSLFLNNQPLNLDSIREKKISLKWWQNSVGFEFASTSYTLKNSVQYSYQLEGADPSWLTAIGDSKIVYSSLRPGAYKFKVRANTSFQEELSDEDAISFSIDAPFWDTFYFKITVVLLIVLSAYLMYRVRINRYILEAKIKSKISRDLHDNIGSSLSSIGLMLKVVIGKLENHSVQPLLNKIAHNTHITQENLDDIVWNISSEKRTLSDIVDRMHEFIYGIFEEQNIRLDFSVADDIKNLVMRPDRRYDLYLIFKELINNAAKYAMANNITVELGLDRDEVKFRYSDDGVGFEPEKQTGGNGLSNIKNRTKNLRGTLVFQSAPGNGTTFLLRFPIK